MADESYFPPRLSGFFILLLLSVLLISGTILIFFKYSIPTNISSSTPVNKDKITTSPPNTVGAFCGGIAGILCPEGFSCKLEGDYPDAGGTCIPVVPTSSSSPKTTGNCKTGGCSSELCLDINAPERASICIYRADYACYKYAVCEKQSTGHCGWTQTPEYLSCLKNLSR